MLRKRKVVTLRKREVVMLRKPGHVVPGRMWVVMLAGPGIVASPRSR